MGPLFLEKVKQILMHVVLLIIHELIRGVQVDYGTVGKTRSWNAHAKTYINA